MLLHQLFHTAVTQHGSEDINDYGFIKVYVGHSYTDRVSLTLEVTRLDMYITHIIQMRDFSVSIGQVGAITGSLITVWGQNVYTPFLACATCHMIIVSAGVNFLLHCI
jgi:hypothetical protein